MAGFYFSRSLQDFFAKTWEILVITTESANLHQKPKLMARKVIKGLLSCCCFAFNAKLTAQPLKEKLEQLGFEKLRPSANSKQALC